MARRDARDEIASYREAQSIRSHRENDWRLASAYCLPQHYGGWQTEGPVSYNGGMAATKRIAYDTSGTRSLPKYMAVLERLATPSGSRYQTLTASDESLRRHHRVRAYFDEVTKLIFKMRQLPRSGFRTGSNEIYASMGVYGTGPIYVGQRPRNPTYNLNSIMYKACPLRDIFFLIDDNGEVVAVYRRFWLNVRQFRQKFGNEAPMPTAMQSEANKASPSETNMFEFVHVTRVRDNGDYDEKALDARRHPISASYICVPDQAYVGDEAGFRSLPYLTPRTFTISGDPYGFSPAQMALSALGGASAVKKVYLKQGNKAVDPVLLAYDDGILNGEVDLRPGAVNYGGVDKQGRRLIQALDTGNFQVAEKLLEKDIADVEDCFFVTLFQILQETPEMTATEVIERVAEKVSLLSPTMGRLQSEWLGPVTEREIDLLAEMGLLPAMPPELVEAQGEFEIVYTSPMAKGIYAEETAGFMRTLEMALGVAQQTGDVSGLDHFDLDVALPEIADHQAVPTRWMRTFDKVKELREDRQAQAEQSEVMSNAGGIAQLAKVATEAEQPKGRRRAV